MIAGLTDLLINVLTVVIVSVGVDILTSVDITVVDVTVVGLRFAMSASYTEDLMLSVFIDTLSGLSFVKIRTGIDAEVLADMVYVNILATVVTGLEFEVIESLEQSMRFC